ncbi:MAG: glucose-6-phosphate dehydrogenase assembly protein OpcA [Acidobacteria bacterium]|nr:glucose-6-phosphate dehydrogenase assembly protein OpcA [Acidobacteriota bacterium]
MASKIVPETLLGELRQLWLSLSKAEVDAGQPGVLRSCTMTLIVATDQPEGDSLDQTLAELMHAHPSRTIVLRLLPGDAPRLEAGVRAHCWKPFGSRQQLCCELIRVEFTRERLDGVANLLQGLLVPDLPAVLWARSERLATAAEFQPLLPLASRVVVDSMLAPNAEAAIAAVRKLSAGGRQVADLAWTRLTPWRKMTADLFDALECRQRLGSVSEITVTHLATGAPPPSALYLGAWLAAGLKGRPGVEYRSAESGSQGAFPQGSIQSVVMRAPEFEIVLKVTNTTPGVRQIELRAGTLESHCVLPEVGETALMNEELRISGADHHFERALSGVRFG